MRFNSLHDWLIWQESLHPETIELGLDRVSCVLQALKLSDPDFFIITVAGTNGKGSCVAMLESILLQAGYQVGAFTSPHLLRYNERIRVQGEEASDECLCNSFARIDAARAKTSLTYFEFGALAAIDVFARSNIDIAILEVGLGGRLDAVNVLDADIAVLTSLGIDHTNWLGHDRETIAMEKAGIIRTQRPVVIGELDAPGVVLEYARRMSAPVYCNGDDFGGTPDLGSPTAWSWWCKDAKRNSLNYPALRGEKQLQNASTVLMVLQLMSASFPIDQQAVRQGLLNVALPGRFQIVPGPVLQILDVAHNVQAVKYLVETLKQQGCSGKTHAVVGMMQDKDIQGVLELMSEVVDQWFIADLNIARGAKTATISNMLNKISSASVSTLSLKAGVEKTVKQAPSVTQAHKLALESATDGDRIVIFGSFITVAEVLHHVL